MSILWHNQHIKSAYTKWYLNINVFYRFRYVLNSYLLIEAGFHYK